MQDDLLTQPYHWLKGVIGAWENQMDKKSYNEIEKVAILGFITGYVL